MSLPELKETVPLSEWTERWLGGRIYQSGKSSSTGAPPWDFRGRDGLVKVYPTPCPAHVGLWLDCCLVEPESDAQEEARPGRDALQRGAIEALKPGQPALKMYRPIIERWQKRAEAPSDTSARRVIALTTTTRLLLHAATGESVTEGTILLHHTYGVPYLPGSALKGICRARARRLGRLIPKRYEQIFAREGSADSRVSDEKGLDKEPAWVTQLFGYVETEDEGGLAGLIDFWDALWLPTPKAVPLALDIVNPHHSKYYTDINHPEPNPTEEPLPTHFLSIAPDTHFLLVLELRAQPGAEGWLDFVLDELLLPALELDGIGAKTSAGYGRLVPVGHRKSAWVLGEKETDQNRSAKPGTPGAQRGGNAPAMSDAGVEPGMLTRNPGDGTLRATLSGNAVAEVRGQRAKDLFLSLSPDVQEKIKKGKSQRLMVHWTKVGNGRQIDDLKEP